MHTLICLICISRGKRKNCIGELRWYTCDTYAGQHRHHGQDWLGKSVFSGGDAHWTDPDNVFLCMVVQNIHLGHVATENGKRFIETHFHHGQRSRHIFSQNRHDVTISSSAWRAVMLVDQTVNFVIGLFSYKGVLTRVHPILLVHVWCKQAQKCTTTGQRIAKMPGCVEYVWPKRSSADWCLKWGCYSGKKAGRLELIHTQNGRMTKAEKGCCRYGYWG